jgi:predicted transposase YbfD/YdcC
MQNIPLLEHFSVLPDPRKADHGKTQHELLSIVIIAILAVICGADSWVEISTFGREKQTWLATFLNMENGVPSHDTFGRIFSLLDPSAFDQCFSAWVKTVRRVKKGEVVAIDGKSIRRSHGTDTRPLHLVNAFAAEHGIVLGQREVDGKSNEIIAIPELLDLLHIKGCIITTDAMGCQGYIVKKALENKADYVLAVKGNQGRLEEDIVSVFEKDEVRIDRAETSERSHGREETRACRVTDDLSSIRDRHRWDGLTSIAAVTRTWNDRTGIRSSETRYFISSLAPDAQDILRVVRAHWRVENSLHWSLDISFREDESRVRVGHAGQNLALVRKLALNLLRRETSAKMGIKAKRLQAGWSEEYLLTVLGVNG